MTEYSNESNSIGSIIQQSSQVIPSAYQRTYKSDNSLNAQSYLNMIEIYGAASYLVRKLDLSNSLINDLPLLPKSYTEWNREGVYKHENRICLILKVNENLSSFAKEVSANFGSSNTLKHMHNGYYFIILDKVALDITKDGKLYYSPSTFSFFLRDEAFDKENSSSGNTSYIVPFLVLKEFCYNDHMDCLWVILAIMYLKESLDNTINYSDLGTDAEIELAEKYFEYLKGMS